METPLIVHSYPKSAQLFVGEESVSFLGASSPTDLPYHTLEENSRLPLPDLCHGPLKLDNQVFHHPRQDLRYHILSTNRTNNRLQCFISTRNRQLTGLTDTSTELKFGITVNFTGLNRHLIPTPTQIKHRTFPRLFVVTSF